MVWCLAGMHIDSCVAAVRREAVGVSRRSRWMKYGTGAEGGRLRRDVSTGR